MRELVVAEAAQCDDYAGPVGRGRRVHADRPPTPSRERRRRHAQAFRNLPAFCRIAATLTPSSDSDIKIEVWLPASGWNGKFQAVGNGGWGGPIRYPAMGEAIRRGYATTGTNTGHVGGGASWALGHPEKLADYAYRSQHEMTVKAKAVTAAFYGEGPKLLVLEWLLGGRQGRLRRGAAVSGGFQRHHRRFPGDRLDRASCAVAARLEGPAQGRGQRDSAGQVSGHPRRRGRGVRHARRGQGWGHRRSDVSASSTRRCSPVPKRPTVRRA